MRGFIAWLEGEIFSVGISLSLRRSIGGGIFHMYHLQPSLSNFCFFCCSSSCCLQLSSTFCCAKASWVFLSSSSLYFFLAFCYSTVSFSPYSWRLSGDLLPEVFLGFLGSEVEAPPIIIFSFMVEPISCMVTSSWDWYCNIPKWGSNNVWT